MHVAEMERTQHGTVLMISLSCVLIKEKTVGERDKGQRKTLTPNRLDLSFSFTHTHTHTLYLLETDGPN